MPHLHASLHRLYAKLGIAVEGQGDVRAELEFARRTFTRLLVSGNEIVGHELATLGVESIAA
jgi:hypothetical protein